MSDDSPTTKATVTERIDSDVGLKAKGKLLTIISLLFIGIMLSGATIEETNTFVFKVIVANQAGLPALFLGSIFFLLIRYYTYARHYHVELEKIWTARLLKNSFYLEVHCQTDECSGVIYEHQPKGFGLDDPGFGYNENASHSYSYHRGWFLCRYIDYEWYREHEEGEVRISLFSKLKFIDYLNALRLEFKYRTESFFIDREYLDIFAPYLIAVLALASFFFRSYFQSFVNILVNVSL